MKFNQPPLPDEPDIQITPLIDVVFLILVAFIYTSMFLTQKVGLPIDLPQAKEATAQAKKALTLTMTADGALYLNQQPIRLESLASALSAARAANPDVVLYLGADHRARLGSLVEVLDIARAAGIGGLTIATERAAPRRP